jgi:hypothetical protein
MFELVSDRLRIEVAEPGEPPNDNCRFAYSGYVTEMVLDKKYRFGASEPNHLQHPSSGGRGLCNEFKADLSTLAQPGEYYPKFGIGLIKKEDDRPYVFYGKYLLKQFPISYTKTSDEVIFTVEPIECMGYALKHIKILKVQNNVLWMTEKVENVGEKNISTQEYCHNMLTIDSLALGPAYHFRMPDLAEQGKGLIAGTIRGEGYGITFSGYSRDPARFVMDCANLKRTDDFTWEMANTDASPNPNGEIAVLCTEYVTPSYLQFWAVDHLMSLEVFHTVNLKPGESKEWKRKWVFRD